MNKLKKDKIARIIFLIILDIIALFASYYFTFYLDTHTYILAESFGNQLIYLAAGIYLKIVILICFGMYNTLWRYASIEELGQIMLAVLVANILTGVMFFFVGYNVIATALIINFLLDLFYIGGIRICYRLGRRFKSKYLNKKELREECVLIYGAGEAGVQMIKEAINSKEKYKIAGFLDDDILKKGKQLNGFTVFGGRDKLAEVVKAKDVTLIIIAMPSVSNKEINHIAEDAHQTGVAVKILPNFDEILNFDVSFSRLRDLQIEDLLNREEVTLDKKEISNFIKGKVILVTGGSGSIGSELCRQIIRYEPKEMVILDIYENTLYYLELELNQFVNNKSSHKKTKLQFEIASIRDKKRMDELFDLYRPQVVFHAAAHKHVPLMEKTPKEAIKNNVFGTKNILDTCIKYQTEKFVQISTDKAVKPTNVMGTSKRICEILIQSYNRTNKTDFVAVRFGNVLGSNGSVIPIFKEQIASGGPVTVTDKNIERFFMTIPEASQLVLQAGSIAQGGEIFVLDMGEPVKILDLAKRMIKLSGYEPYEEIDIKFSGLRPGEKLYEELSYDLTAFDRTKHKGIFVEKLQNFDKQWVKESLCALQKIIDEGTDEEIIDELKKIVPDYYPNR